MPKELQPPELDALVDFAERPRAADWSLRAALVRYAQAQPRRVSDLLEQVRRVEGVFHGHRKLLEQHGAELWGALDGGPSEPEHTALVGVLAATRELDRAGEVLATWAVDRGGEPPDAVVDEVTASVGRQLDEIGVPREQPHDGQRPRGGRGSRGV